MKAIRRQRYQCRKEGGLVYEVVHFALLKASCCYRGYPFLESYKERLGEYQNHSLSVFEVVIFASSMNF